MPTADLITDLLQRIHTRVASRLPVFQKQLSALLETTLNNSREVQLIANDADIRGQVGVSSISKLYTLNKLLSQDIRLDFRPFKPAGKKVSGYIRAFCIDVDLRAALESPDAYEFIKVRAANWKWFEWLTMMGDRIVGGYHYLPSRVAPRVADYSRTGIGIQAPAKLKSWHMPTNVSGQHGNNYISRAVSTPDFFQKLDPILYSLIS